MTESDAIRLFKCLADKSRLRILKSLMVEDMYVERLAERLDLSAPTITFHLKKLIDAGAVESQNLLNQGKNIPREQYLHRRLQRRFLYDPVRYDFRRYPGTRRSNLLVKIGCPSDERTSNFIFMSYLRTGWNTHNVWFSTLFYQCQNRNMLFSKLMYDRISHKNISFHINSFRFFF